MKLNSDNYIQDKVITVYDLSIFMEQFLKYFGTLAKIWERILFPTF